MHARVATFEGGDTEQVRQVFAEINRRSASGPPEGLPSVGLLMLHSPDDGKVIAISLFETPETLEQGDAVLNAMEPPGPGNLGRRASVERYEVGIKLDA